MQKLITLWSIVGLSVSYKLKKNYLGTIYRSNFSWINFKSIVKNIKLALRKLSFRNSCISFAFLVFLFFSNSTKLLAYDNPQIKINSLQNKISVKFTKKFCNSIGFGISKESAISFALGENKKELMKNKLIDQINKNELEEQIASDVISSCGNALGLSGSKGADEFKSSLLELSDSDDLI